MKKYSDQETADDKERILTALDELNRVREQYADVIAIPEVVTLHDIMEYRLDTSLGPVQFKRLYNRKIGVEVLSYFAGTDYISPELFESTIVCAIEHRKKERKTRANHEPHRTDQD